MGDIPVGQVIGDGDWSTGLLDCCGGDSFGKGGDSAGATVCREVGWHPEVFLSSVCGCCGYSFLLYYLRHISKHTPKPMLGALLGPSCLGCGCTQYDCAFGQNLIIVAVCSCISMPYFRCKLREQYGIKGNIVFDILACAICCQLAQFQEFRESAMRDKLFATQTSGGKFGTDEIIPDAIYMGDEDEAHASEIPVTHP
mmetsp:Transcript_2391/g.6424  ORF Transcript_2391/g.6424 Transcript_2391/m.6424 type:complete len:198 (-) Transcript_2391:486-1079(-)|eukprot:CAMPEP_0113723080 /NCGR_PEP_ID=MMETSP0038_2-20120614/38176_1 /TAXON_ID=2898 /ORGANISM="Cryptomonas paramecium" /LENGTH=197 /DNA_ID=CAMNT_0000652533 /DNA_START=19 /DNA_END=612 /DNA_ORIENTATION=+ /assembly_acc=CAM_ASM_000170